VLSLTRLRIIKIGKIGEFPRIFKRTGDEFSIYMYMLNYRHFPKTAAAEQV